MLMPNLRMNQDETAETANLAHHTSVWYFYGFFTAILNCMLQLDYFIGDSQYIEPYSAKWVSKHYDKTVFHPHLVKVHHSFINISFWRSLVRQLPGAPNAIFISWAPGFPNPVRLAPTRQRSRLFSIGMAFGLKDTTIRHGNDIEIYDPASNKFDISSIDFCVHLLSFIQSFHMWKLLILQISCSELACFNCWEQEFIDLLNCIFCHPRKMGV